VLGQILKFLVDYLTKILVVAVPLYGQYIAKWRGFEWLADEKLRALVSVGLFTALFIYQARDTYIAQVSADGFLRDYVKGQDHGIPVENWGQDLRLNVMYLRRAWWTLFVLRAFEMRGRKGFEHPDGIVHPDEDLVLLAWQGLAGLAVKEKAPQYASGGPPQPGVRHLAAQPTWMIWQTLWLLPWQVRKTQRLKAILSVPMALENKRGTRKIVGVINLDAISDAGAAYIDQHRLVLTRALASLGRHLARLP
jgi:hypothetical protein